LEFLEEKILFFKSIIHKPSVAFALSLKEIGHGSACLVSKK